MKTRKPVLQTIHEFKPLQDDSEFPLLISCHGKLIYVTHPYHLPNAAPFRVLETNYKLEIRNGPVPLEYLKTN